MLPHPLRERDILLAWFLYAVCAVIGGALVGGIFGGILGAIGYVAGFSAATHRTTFLVVGGAGGLIASYLLFRAFVLGLIVRKVLAARGDPENHGGGSS